jgi:signal transduction histidine kinase/DNA-binding response OmpR family regulator
MEAGAEKNKLLIVDDNPHNLYSFQAILGAPELEILTAASGEEALRLLLEHPDVALILMDAQMPGMDGFETTELIRGQPRFQDVPILFITAIYRDDEFARRGFEVGASDYILKPVDGSLLASKVNVFLTLQNQKRQLAREIAARQQVEEALQQRNRRLITLNRASQALNSTLDLDTVIVIALEEIHRLLGAVASSLWLVEPETSELVCQQATGPQSEVVRGSRLALGEGIAGWVAHKGQGLIVPDTRADARHFGRVDQRTGIEMRSILTAPLRVKEQVIGAVQVVDTEANRFSATDLVLLDLLATPIAITIDNARLVKALRQRTAELEARNEELDAFAHSAAHDLKGPLGYMVGFAQVLEQDYTTLPEEDLRHSLRTIVQSGRKMSNIVDELLLLAGLREVEVEVRPLDMARVVEEAQARLAYMIEECQAEITLPDSWPVALGHEPWVEEVWVNYLSNAIKYGGQPPRVELGATVQADSTVRFWIRDDGPGIAPQDQARLFTPLTRLDQAHTKGHGLGLSIVRRIVEKLGGQVGVESDMGQGSVFFFTLPGVASETHVDPKGA